MGTKTTRFDDLNPEVTDGVEQVRFALQDDIYLIDLGKENVNALKDALKPFIKVAEKAPSTTQVKRPKVPAKEIREWAKDQPADVRDLITSDQGALPKAVIAAYNKTNGTSY